MFYDLLQEIGKLKKSTGIDEYAKVIYATSEIDIDCRIEDKIKLVKNSKGNEVVSTTTVYTNYVDINLQDRINGREIVRISKIKEINGNVIGLGVYLS